MSLHDRFKAGDGILSDCKACNLDVQLPCSAKDTLLELEDFFDLPVSEAVGDGTLLPPLPDSAFDCEGGSPLPPRCFRSDIDAGSTRGMLHETLETRRTNPRVDRGVFGTGPLASIRSELLAADVPESKAGAEAIWRIP
jgi:hypothetical protein